MSEFEKDSEYKKKRSSFQNRFGIKVTKFGIIAVPQLLLFRKRLGLTMSEFFFAVLILSKRFDNRSPYFSIKKLKRELGESEATMHRAKNGLVRKGYLKVKPRAEKNPRGRPRNEYNIDPLISVLKGVAESNFAKMLKKNNWSPEEMLDYIFEEDSDNQKDSLDTNK